MAAGTTELHVVRTGPKADRRYVRYLLSSWPFLHGGEAEMVGVAGQKRVPDDWLRNLLVPVVDLGRQEEIAHFLDTEADRIDTLISKKLSLVELLGERAKKRQTEAVCGRLNRLATRDSGCKWLGRI